MSHPDNSGDRAGLVKLLDRLADVDRARVPRFMPDVIAGQWVRSDPDARRRIEESIDRLPRRKLN